MAHRPHHRHRGRIVKRAIVRQRRTLADGRRLLLVVCPVCDHRHWVPLANTARCPRKPGVFTIGAVTR
jgi:hypothetical protein